MQRLHVAVQQGWFTESDQNLTKVIKLLLYYGADINILNSLEKTPLSSNYYLNNKIEIPLIQELAKLKFENQIIRSENLHCLQVRKDMQETLKNCLEELKRMKNKKIYENILLYDMFQMRKKLKKLVYLTKNEDFVENFKLGWNRELFPNYANDLDDIVNDALERKDVLVKEEKKLYLIFKNYLPELPILKIAYFSTKDLFF